MGSNIIFEDTISEINEIISKTNIEVLKCFIHVFIYYSDNYDDIIILSLFEITIICTIFFLFYNFKK